MQIILERECCVLASKTSRITVFLMLGLSMTSSVSVDAAEANSRQENAKFEEDPGHFEVDGMLDRDCLLPAFGAKDRVLAQNRLRSQGENLQHAQEVLLADLQFIGKAKPVRGGHGEALLVLGSLSVALVRASKIASRTHRGDEDLTAAANRLFLMSTIGGAMPNAGAYTPPFTEVPAVKKVVERALLEIKGHIAIIQNDLANFSKCKPHGE